MPWPVSMPSMPRALLLIYWADAWLWDMMDDGIDAVVPPPHGVGKAGKPPLPSRLHGQGVNASEALPAATTTV